MLISYRLDPNKKPIANGKKEVFLANSRVKVLK